VHGAACARSGEGSDHLGSYVRDLSMHTKGSLMHIVPACVGSGEGPDHFESYVRSLSISRTWTSCSQGNNFTTASELPFFVLSLFFVSCGFHL
jgi:hypothetical protein